MLGGIPCQDCRTAAQWPLVAEQAYHSLKTWFLALDPDPADVGPYESAEGGYQWIWGGPFEASDVIASAWAEVFTPHSFSGSPGGSVTKRTAICGVDVRRRSRTSKGR